MSDVFFQKNAEYLQLHSRIKNKLIIGVFIDQYHSVRRLITWFQHQVQGSPQRRYNNMYMYTSSK